MVGGLSEHWDVRCDRDSHDGRSSRSNHSATRATIDKRVSVYESSLLGLSHTLICLSIVVHLAELFQEYLGQGQFLPPTRVGGENCPWARQSRTIPDCNKKTTTRATIRKRINVNESPRKRDNWCLGLQYALSYRAS